jgi:hypothetical protein
MKKIIALAGFTRTRGVRGSKRPVTLYVTGCTFFDGDGFRVKKVSYAQDRSKAHGFSTIAAQAIAEYLTTCGWYPTVEEEGQ